MQKRDLHVCKRDFVFLRSLQTTSRVKGSMELWWLWIHPLTQMPWPELWRSPATNTCCTNTCMRRWGHWPSCTGTTEGASRALPPTSRNKSRCSSILRRFPYSYLIIKYISLLSTHQYYDMFCPSSHAQKYRSIWGSLQFNITPGC